MIRVSVGGKPAAPARLEIRLQITGSSRPWVVKKCWGSPDDPQGGRSRVLFRAPDEAACEAFLRRYRQS